MGFRHEKRPILARGGVLASTGSTMTGTDVFGGLATEGPFRIPVHSQTLAAAQSTIPPDGVTFLTYASSGGARDAVLPNPEFSGQVKEVFLIKQTSSEEAQIHTNSTSQTFAGTTYNTITTAASTTFTAGTPYLRLVAESTSSWAVTCGSTVDWDFAASTGSTADTAGN